MDEKNMDEKTETETENENERPAAIRKEWLHAKENAARSARRLSGAALAYAAASRLPREEATARANMDVYDFDEAIERARSAVYAAGLTLEAAAREFVAAEHTPSR
jgi:hypothetical protein